MDGTTAADLVRTGGLVVGELVGAIVRACLLGDCVGAVVMGNLVGTVVRDCVVEAFVGLVEAGALEMGAKVIGGVVDDMTAGDLLRTGALVVAAWVGAIVRACSLSDLEGAVFIMALVGTVVRDCVVGAFVGIVDAKNVGALVTGTIVTGLGVDVATVGGLVRLGAFVVGAEVGAKVRACLLGG